MKPEKHLIASILLTAVLSAFFGLDIQGMLLWITLGALAGTLVDLDHLVIGMVIGRKSLMRDLFNPHSLINDFAPGGRLNIFTRSGMSSQEKLRLYFYLSTHSTTIVSVYVLSGHFLGDLALPIQYSATAHLTYDLARVLHDRLKY